jgi:superoxide dismutase
VKELAKENSKPIWQHFTANKPTKTTVSRKISNRKHTKHKKMYDNPLTNVYERLRKKRLSSRVITTTKVKYKTTQLITTMYKKLGKKRSTSRDKTILDIEAQIIGDRFGDVPR